MYLNDLFKSILCKIKLYIHILKRYYIDIMEELHIYEKNTKDNFSKELISTFDIRNTKFNPQKQNENTFITKLKMRLEQYDNHYNGNKGDAFTA